MLKGEMTALYQWGIDQGFPKDVCLKMCLRAMQGGLSECKRKIDWWESEAQKLEAEMTAIEEASGIELPLDDDDPEPTGKSILEYVEQAS
jgi:hypothetical protein